MNEYNDLEPAQSMSAFLPLTLLGISVLLGLIFQVSVMVPQRTLLQNVITHNEKGVQQSKQVQAGLQKLVMDLIAAAPQDKDAQAIITKYGIQVSGTSPVPAASPAASAAAATPAESIVTAPSPVPAASPAK